MSPLLRYPSIGRCSALSRSFLLGPGGGAALPLDSACTPAVTWQLAEAGTSKISPIRVSSLPGEPRSTAHAEMRVANDG